jgi:ABC-type multidrug transport system fused ATPase/permease subunit
MGGRYGVCNSCTVEDLDEKNTTDYYLDNFLLYFSNLKNKFNNNKYQFFSEIIIISPLFAILNYLRFLFELLIAFYLNPFYILIGDNLIFIIKYLLKSILFYSRIRGKVDDGDDPRDIKLEKVRLILSFVVQVVSCIFYLVFLEIIELRFCGLDENLKKNMEERGQLEAIRKSLDSSSDLVLGDDEDDDDNMNNDINDKKMEMSNY